MEKKIRALSGGEKSRLAMARMLYNPPNFLVLDEPTNHLDLATKEMLVEALKDFEGTMIFVSHDRTFLRGLGSRVLELGGESGTDREPRIYPGPIPNMYRHWDMRLLGFTRDAACEVIRIVTAPRMASADSNGLQWQRVFTDTLPTMRMVSGIQADVKLCGRPNARPSIGRRFVLPDTGRVYSSS